MIAISSPYYYIALYILYLRNLLNKLSNEDLEYLIFNSYYTSFKRAFNMPPLEDINNFNINIIATLNANELAKERKLIPEFLEYIENLDNNLSIKEYLKLNTNIYFKFYIYEYYLLDFPKYFILFDKVFKTVMINDFTLDPSVKYYIAIMAASVVKSYFLYKLLEFNFIIIDGDESWLIYGLSATPNKFQVISPFLNKLANSCWTLTKEDLSYIKSANLWNDKELISVISIFLFMQRVACIAESLGLSKNIYDSKLCKYMCTQTKNNYLFTSKNVNEIRVNNLKNKLYEVLTESSNMSSPKLSNKIRSKISTSSSVKTFNNNNSINILKLKNKKIYSNIDNLMASETIHKKIRKLSDSLSINTKYNCNLQETYGISFDNKTLNDCNVTTNNSLNSNSLTNKNITNNSSLYDNSSEYNTTKVIMNDTFNEYSTVNDNIISECKLKKEMSLLTTNIEDIFSKNIDLSNKKYIDFDSRLYDYESYFTFNWTDQAYYILRDITPDTANIFNEETEYAYEMTSNTLGHIKNIDTRQIRFAIWSYIEKIYGLEREDYSYSIVNKLLDKEDKTFIKNSCCYPELIIPENLNKLSFSFKEIIHIIVISNASRFRTQFTFFISRLSSLMNDN